MEQVLTIEVRFFEGRYHGSGGWPPAPARLFQALVAAAACRGRLSEAALEALSWLEALPPPTIVAPKHTLGQNTTHFVPNNDLDSKQGNPRHISKVRTAKQQRPILFEAGQPLTYIWRIQPDRYAKQNAQKIAHIANNIFQLGRGIDMAWAEAEVLEAHGDSFVPVDSDRVTFQPRGLSL